LSRKIFVLNNTLTLKDDEIEGILGRRVYVIITKSKGEVRDKE